MFRKFNFSPDLAGKILNQVSFDTTITAGNQNDHKSRHDEPKIIIGIQRIIIMTIGIGLSPQVSQIKTNYHMKNHYDQWITRNSRIITGRIWIN